MAAFVKAWVKAIVSLELCKKRKGCFCYFGSEVTWISVKITWEKCSVACPSAYSWCYQTSVMKIFYENS